MRRSTASAAFTLLEVLAILLLVVVGTISVIGLVGYAMRKAGVMQGRMTGLATAEAVAFDPTPLLDPDPTDADPALSADWTYSGAYDMDNIASEQTSTAQGFINGFYVVRSESSRPEDVIGRGTGASGALVVFARSAHVSVEVYESFGGRNVASYATRIVRQRGRP